MSASESLCWIFIGVVVAAMAFGFGPMLLAHLRKKPIKRIWLIGFCFLNYVTLVAIRFFLKTSIAFYAGLHIIPAFIWAIAYYFLAKKRLRKRGLLVETEEPVFQPAPPVEAVDYSETLSEYTFITPGEKKSSLQEPSANTVPAQPQVVGVQANVRGPIVTPVSASEPVPQEVVSNKHTGLKVFSVIITLLFIASAAYAVMLHFNLRTANAEIHRLETANVALKKDAENARAAQISAEKNLEKMRSEHLELTLSELTQRLMLKQIGYIYEGYRNYHAYPKCSIVAAADTYTAHNTNYCEYLGYDPCPLCWDN